MHILAFAVILLASQAPLPAAMAAEPAQENASKLSLPARGVVRAVDRATISTDLQARASSIAFREGQNFKKGDVLVEFDCRRHRAELSSAEAQQRETQLSLENNLVLKEHRAIGSHEVAISRARVDKASGEAEALRARVDDCRIIAPFDGRVSELGIHVFETPPPGKPFISIIDDSKLEIELIVPSDWLVWLKQGADFHFHVDELNRSVPAQVMRIGAAVDPISQTVKLIAQFADGADLQGILAGMSGAADFTPGKG